MAIVTISRHYGAGGHTLGNHLCERFGFQLVDASIINGLARKSRLAPEWLTAMEKEASSTLLTTISSLCSHGLWYKPPCSVPDEDRKKYIVFLTRIFEAMAREGRYVIIGRGAQFILRGHPRVIHVLLVADYENRVAFLMEKHHLSRSEAERKIRVQEKERAAMASRLFGADIDDAGLYNIVLNTSLMPYEWAFETLSQLLEQAIMREIPVGFRGKGAGLPDMKRH